MSDSDFMQPEIYEDSYYEVETRNGTEFIPCSVVGCYTTIPGKLLRDYVEDELLHPKEHLLPKHGWICRLSASGYLDCTPWAAFATEQECRDYLDEMYGGME